MAIIVNEDYIERYKAQSAHHIESAIREAVRLTNNKLALIEIALRMPKEIVVHENGIVTTKITLERLLEMTHADFVQMEHRDLASLCGFMLRKLCEAQIECQN